MSTLTGDAPEQQLPLRDTELNALPRCKRCNLAYLTQKSTSALRLTYCSFLCELGDLGFSMSGLEMMEKAPIIEKLESTPEPVAVD